MKKQMLIFAAIMLLLAGNVLAQTKPTEAVIVKYDNDGIVVWEKSLGGNVGDNYSYATAVPDGVVAVGNLDGKGIIVKYDNDGNVVWKNKSKNRFSSVTAVPNGVVAVGNLYKDEMSAIAIIVKYDNKGKVVWEKKGNMDSYNSITIVSDGIVVAGEENSAGDVTSFIVKYDNKGNVVWEKHTKCFDGCKVITVPNGLVAVGAFYPEAIIIKYDKKGNVVWEKKKKIGNDDIFSSVTSISDSVLVVGRPRISNGYSIIVKYDNEGKEFVWETKKKYDPSKIGTSSYFSVMAISDGVVLTGNFLHNIYENGIPVTTPIIDKYDYDGNFVWRQEGNRGDSYSSVIAVPDGVVMVGSKALDR